MSPKRACHQHPELSSPRQKRMVSVLHALAPNEGYNLTALPSVRILRSNRALSRTPVLYDPGIVIVCQGRKRGYFGGQLYLYNEHHYLAVSMPVPFSMETDATPARPLLALYLHLDFTLAAELAEQIDRAGPTKPVQAPQSMTSTPTDEAMQRLWQRSQRVTQRLESLSLREIEVLAMTLEGMACKQLAAKLGISECTAQTHRRRLMRKLQTGSIPELVRLAETLRVTPGPSLSHSHQMRVHFERHAVFSARHTVTAASSPIKLANPARRIVTGG